MIDDSDASLAFFLIGGPLGLIVAIILYCIAAGNAKTCSELACPSDAGTARLLDHECVCVAEPLPR